MFMRRAKVKWPVARDRGWIFKVSFMTNLLFHDSMKLKDEVYLKVLGSLNVIRRAPSLLDLHLLYVCPTP